MSPSLLRTFASLITVVGLVLLGVILAQWQAGELAHRYFPDLQHETRHHLYSLGLALAVPLHVIFIGLITQKRFLSPAWSRFAWIGIVSSGVWLGLALLIRTLWL